MILRNLFFPVLLVFAFVVVGCSVQDLRVSSSRVEQKTVLVRDVLFKEGVSVSEEITEGEYPCEKFSFLNSGSLLQREFTISGALPFGTDPEAVKRRVAAVLPPVEEVPVAGGVSYLRAEDEWGRYILRFDPIGDIDAVSFRGVTVCGEPEQTTR